MLLEGSVAPIGWLQAIFLGLLQGLTEFLPVSSTAHMAVAPQLLFGMDDPGAAFSAVAQLGPIVAIIAYFRRDLGRYVAGILRTKSPLNLPADDVDARLGWYTLLGTLPLAVFGVLLEKRIDNQFRRLDVIAYALIGLALVLMVAERVGKRRTSLEAMTLKQSQVVGWAQVLGLIPGASRSGVTITAGLFQGLDRESAARFSFLLSIPAITAAGLYKLFKVVWAARKAHEMSSFVAQAGPYLLAAVVAGLFAYLVVRWFLGFMKTHDTRIFIAYRIALGLLLLFLLKTGRVHDTHNPTAPTAGGETAQVGRATVLARAR